MTSMPNAYACIIRKVFNLESQTWGDTWEVPRPYAAFWWQIWRYGNIKMSETS